MKIDKLKIAQIMARQQLSQADLAKKCNVRPPFIGEILKRETCNIKTLGKIAKALETDAAELIIEKGGEQMTRISIFQLMRLMPNANITYIRVWADDEEQYFGTMDKCPKEYLHRPIAELAAGEYELIIYY